MTGRVVVVGGGLAGIAAALRCADLGEEVTLLESRPRLGGLAFSFQRDGLTIDNGQHVFLRCCSAYRWLLERLGATGSTTLQRRLDIPVLEAVAGGVRTARIARTPGVPAPAHLTGALARYSVLPVQDRLRAARAALALRLLDPADPSLDKRTLGEFLRAHGQTRALIDRLWGVLSVATLNLDPDQASLALAAKVFRTGVLDHAAAGDVGYAAVPLGEIHSGAAGRALAAAGVDVRLAHRVEKAEPGSVTARHRNATETMAADRIVLAVPPRDAVRVTPSLAGTTTGRLRELGTSPIVNVHVVYDRRVTDLPFAAAVDSPVQWFFDRTESSGLARRNGRSQYLAVTVSAADGIMEEKSATLHERFVDELARLLPAARQAAVLDSWVTRERHATFRQCAGSAALRPGPATDLDGLWLAGAWTATGWPDTMESAVRSGVTAAETALAVVPPESTRFPT